MGCMVLAPVLQFWHIEFTCRPKDAPRVLRCSPPISPRTLPFVHSLKVAGIARLEGPLEPGAIYWVVLLKMRRARQARKFILFSDFDIASRGELGRFSYGRAEQQGH